MYIEKRKKLQTEFDISFFIFLIKGSPLQPLLLKVLEKYPLLPKCSREPQNQIFFFLIFSVLESHANHFPWGLPESKRKESDETIILTQKHYVTGYQTSLRLPSWVGYRLTKEVVL